MVAGVVVSLAVDFAVAVAFDFAVGFEAFCFEFAADLLDALTAVFRGAVFFLAGLFFAAFFVALFGEDVDFPVALREGDLVAFPGGFRLEFLPAAILEALKNEKISGERCPKMGR